MKRKTTVLEERRKPRTAVIAAAFVVTLIAAILAPSSPAGATPSTPGDPYCVDSGGAHDGAMDFLFNNNRGTTVDRYEITVGPHGHGELKVDPRTTRQFTLKGIPNGTHDVHVRDLDSGASWTWPRRSFNCVDDDGNNGGEGDLATIEFLCESFRGRVELSATNNTAQTRSNYQFRVGGADVGDPFSLGPGNSHPDVKGGLANGVRITAGVYRNGNPIEVKSHTFNCAPTVNDDTTSISYSCQDGVGRVRFSATNNGSARNGAYQFRVGGAGVGQAFYLPAGGTHGDYTGGHNGFANGVQNGTYLARVYRGTEVLRERTITISCGTPDQSHVCGRATVAERYGRPKTGTLFVETDFDCVYVTDGFLIYYNSTADVAYQGRTDRAVIEDLEQKVEKAWEKFGCNENRASAATAPIEIDCLDGGGNDVEGWGMPWPDDSSLWPSGSRTAQEGRRFPVAVGGAGSPADGYSLPHGLQLKPKADNGGRSSDRFGQLFIRHEVFHSFQWVHLRPADLASTSLNAAFESMADYAAARANNPSASPCRKTCVTPSQYIARNSNLVPWAPAYEGEYWFHYLLTVRPSLDTRMPRTEAEFFDRILSELSNQRFNTAGAFRTLYGESIIDYYKIWAS